MKYIRTKDNVVYKVIEEYKNSFELESSFDKVMGCHTFMPKSFIGQLVDYKSADTIEELCDEFVIKYENKDKVSLFDICNNFEATKEEHNNYQNEYKNANIFGAIWTDKGLIYVAKMNDKGDLELL